jgi:hypothetical protein
MTRWLRDDEGHEVNHKRIAGLMQKMGLQAITLGPHTSKATPEHRIYPYLLRKVMIEVHSKNLHLVIGGSYDSFIDLHPHQRY